MNDCRERVTQLTTEFLDDLEEQEEEDYEVPETPEELEKAPLHLPMQLLPVHVTDAATRKAGDGGGDGQGEEED